MAKAWIGGNVPLLSDKEDIAEVFESIEQSILWHKRVADKLREKVNYLELENYKDEELAKMKAELLETREDYRRGFPISKKEDAAIKEWMSNHEKEHSGGHGVSGGKYTYIFVPTGLGTIGTIRCSCGKEFCFQDL